MTIPEKKKNDASSGSTEAVGAGTNEQTGSPTPDGFEIGLTIEYVMLSVTVVSNKESAGQFDDSIAHLIEKHLPAYHGVQRVDAQVLYKHTKIEQHTGGCECGECEPQTPPPHPKAEGIGAEARARLEAIARAYAQVIYTHTVPQATRLEFCNQVTRIILSAYDSLSTAIEEEGRGRVSPAAEAPVTKDEIPITGQAAFEALKLIASLYRGWSSNRLGKIGIHRQRWKRLGEIATWQLDELARRVPQIPNAIHAAQGPSAEPLGEIEWKVKRDHNLIWIECAGEQITTKFPKTNNLFHHLGVITVAHNYALRSTLSRNTGQEKAAEPVSSVVAVERERRIEELTADTERLNELLKRASSTWDGENLALIITDKVCAFKTLPQFYRDARLAIDLKFRINEVLTSLPDEKEGGGRVKTFMDEAPNTLGDATCKGIMAKKYRRKVSFDFNGKTLTVRPGDTKRSVLTRWDRDYYKNRNKTCLYPKTAKEALRRWDEGQSVVSVEMGGLGPGYEQAIQILVFEIIRDQGKSALPKPGTASNGWRDDTVHRCNESCRGFSGAQVGAAKNLAYHYMLDGYEKTLLSFKEKESDRITQVSREFPQVPKANHGAESTGSNSHGQKVSLK